MKKSITNVRDNTKDTKDEIDKVKLTTTAVEDRATVVRNIKAGDEYVTRPPGTGPEAKVHVVKSSSGEFISTNRDESKSDNLGNLPKF